MNKEIPQEAKRNNRTLIILLIILIIVCLSIGIGVGVILYLRSQSKGFVLPNDNEAEIPYGDDAIPEEPDAQSFEGDYVTATLPMDWTIKEYSTAEGMKAYVESPGIEFSGLTGLEILDENNVIVFSIKGVDGIGGGGGCSEIGKFLDTEDSYIQAIKDETEIMGFEPTQVLDLTAENYITLSTFGLEMRRVDNKLYIASEDYPQYFNTLCGIAADFVQIEELDFTITDEADSYTTNVYKFGINQSVNDSETLEELDDVLNSVNVI